MGSFIYEGAGSHRKYTEEELLEIMRTKRTIEAIAIKCNNKKEIEVELGDGLWGTLAEEEFTALTGEDGEYRSGVVSKVGKYVSFKIVDFNVINNKYILSRRAAQADRLNSLQVGDIIDVVVIAHESYGMFVDIGCGIISIIFNKDLTVSGCDRLSELFPIGSELKAIYKKRNGNKIKLSHRELLGSWQENLDYFNINVGDTMVGRITKVGKFGLFIQLTPNISGLADTPIKDNGGNCTEFEVGDFVSVYIKNIVPAKLKIKLSVISSVEPEVGWLSAVYKYHYFKDSGQMLELEYSTTGCEKKRIYSI